MCGRFSLSSNLNDLKNEFSDDLSGNFPARYNIAPGQDSVVVSLFDKKFNLQILNWGFNSLNTSKLLINARSETVHQKVTFSQLLRFQRCLIPANSWFEWKSSKKPYLIKSRNSNLIAFAGLKRLSNNGDPQFIIITSESNQHLKSLHSRTPLVIDKKNYYKWTGTNYEEALTLLKPINGNDFDFHPVSAALGNVNNDNSSLVQKHDYKENINLPLFNHFN